ncbi:hypothetical protein PoB_004075100 [Plakobranchus ocellatus]|uniref:Uncharacterized protein n=1 Tax=Plakobranchus ocellatus TaxID=259542 RepID=A0AAV4AT16_9GAST|nr:hypothetical protein PoB_004075100 [Plakobranchus ocellatus]
MSAGTVQFSPCVSCRYGSVSSVLPQGPEPNTIADGEIDDHLFIFIGIKHPGTIFVYKLGNNLKTPSFQKVFCQGIPEDETKSYRQMHEDHDIYTAGVKDIK